MIFGQVVWGYFNFDLVIGEDVDVVFVYVVGDVGDDFVFIFQVNVESGVWQCFVDGVFEFDGIVF